MRPDVRELCKGRATQTLINLGIDKSILNKKHQPCPIDGCGGKDRFRYSDYKGLGEYICSQCGAGNMFDLAMSYLGIDFKELANRIYDIFGIEEGAKKVEKQTYKTAEQKNFEANAQFLNDVSAMTQKLTGDDPVTKYLNNRGITVIPPTIRYLPQYKQDGEYHPCLIARLDDKDGNRVSYKVIHLTQDGQKANVPIVKKTLPIEREMKGAAVKLYKHNGILAVIEGIEKALQHTQRTGIPTWSLDNAGNMEKFECPRDVKHLIIIADMDGEDPDNSEQQENSRVAYFKGQAAAYSLAEKSGKLIGKHGYQLEQVTVALILRFEADWEIIYDNGVKADYENYYLQDV